MPPKDWWNCVTNLPICICSRRFKYKIIWERLYSCCLPRREPPILRIMNSIFPWCSALMVGDILLAIVLELPCPKFFFALEYPEFERAKCSLSFSKSPIASFIVRHFFVPCWPSSENPSLGHLILSSKSLRTPIIITLSRFWGTP